MMSSYRNPGERDGDRNAYFDYAKSLESRRRPLPWKTIAWFAVLFGVAGFLRGALGGFEPVDPMRGLFFAPMGAILALGLIPIIRSNRALAADNFTETKRR